MLQRSQPKVLSLGQIIFQSPSLLSGSWSFLSIRNSCISLYMRIHTSSFLDCLSVQFSSVMQSCSTLCDPMDCSTPGFHVHHQLLELAQTHVHQVSDAILCHPLLLLPLIFPSIRAFSNKSALHIRWPKYWSFSFSLRPFHEYSGLVSSRID